MELNLSRRIERAAVESQKDWGKKVHSVTRDLTPVHYPQVCYPFARAGKGFIQN
jgi:hypothetical protein